MDDRQRLEDHALQRQRLLGSMVHGGNWRERRYRDAARTLVGGLIIALIVAIGFALVSYVNLQLELQREKEERAGTPGAMVTHVVG